MTKQIALPGNLITIIDDEDFAFVSPYKWSATSKMYVQANVQGRHTYLHRLIMNPPSGMTVDHIDHNPLNNCRQNLRVCTLKENHKNRRPDKDITSQSEYAGVYAGGNDTWLAIITENRKPICIGTFANESEAARAYDKAAYEAFGVTAYFNFPEVQ